MTGAVFCILVALIASVRWWSWEPWWLLTAAGCVATVVFWLTIWNGLLAAGRRHEQAPTDSATAHLIGGLDASSRTVIELADYARAEHMTLTNVVIRCGTPVLLGTCRLTDCLVEFGEQAYADRLFGERAVVRGGKHVSICGSDFVDSDLSALECDQLRDCRLTRCRLPHDEHRPDGATHRPSNCWVQDAVTTTSPSR